MISKKAYSDLKEYQSFYRSMIHGEDIELPEGFLKVSEASRLYPGDFYKRSINYEYLDLFSAVFAMLEDPKLTESKLKKYFCNLGKYIIRHFDSFEKLLNTYILLYHSLFDKIPDVDEFRKLKNCIFRKSRNNIPNYIKHMDKKYLDISDEKLCLMYNNYKAISNVKSPNIEGFKWNGSYHLVRRFVLESSKLELNVPVFDIYIFNYIKIKKFLLKYFVNVYSTSTFTSEVEAGSNILLNNYKKLGIVIF